MFKYNIGDKVKVDDWVYTIIGRKKQYKGGKYEYEEHTVPEGYLYDGKFAYRPEYQIADEIIYEDEYFFSDPHFIDEKFLEKVCTSSK